MAPPVPHRFAALAATLLAGFALVTTPLVAAGQPADSTAARPPESLDSDLGPSTAPPWVPARPVPAAETWETVLRAPGRVLSLVPVGLGMLTRGSLTFVEEHQVIPKALMLYSLFPDVGVIVTPASLGDRTGLGVTVALAPKPVRPYFRAELSGSTLQYNASRLEAGYGPLRARYGYDWRPQDRFYGVGLDASHDAVSTFASQGQHGTLALEYPWERPDRDRARVRMDAWGGPRELVVRRGREDSSPSFDDLFPTLGALQLSKRREHFTYGAALLLDGRRGAPHWSRGARLNLRAERFDKPIEALALRNPGAAGAQFARVEAEVEGGISFHKDPRTLRLALRVVDQEVSGGADRFLLPDLASLGGDEGLVGYEPGRFHDLDMAVGRLSYIFPLAKHLEFDLHAEAGGVYSDVWEAPRVPGLKTSYGVSLRPRLETMVMGALGVDWCREGARLRFSVGGVE